MCLFIDLLLINSGNFGWCLVKILVKYVSSLGVWLGGLCLFVFLVICIYWKLNNVILIFCWLINLVIVCINLELLFVFVLWVNINCVCVLFVVFLNYCNMLIFLFLFY